MKPETQETIVDTLERLSAGIETFKQTNEDRWQAFVVRGGRARKVDLAIGLLNDVEAEVLEGLDAGDEVVLAPDSDLHDGARVRPRA